MKKYISLSYKDDYLGRQRMGKEIENLTQEGWELKDKAVINQGYSAAKTIALGAIFLPLALLGRKGNKIEVVMEKEITDREAKEMKSQTEFMKSGKTNVVTNSDGSINCPECGAHIKSFTIRGLILKTKIYICPICHHETQR